MRTFSHIRSGRFHNRRGAASALIILMLVLLIFFGVLALVTAAADLRLAEKRAEWNQYYYLADRRAQGVLAQIDSLCHQDVFNNGSVSDQMRQLDSFSEHSAYIAHYTVTRTTDAIEYEARVILDEGPEQGIDMTLLIDSDPKSAEEREIQIIRWNWWRPGFDYGGKSGGLWEG
jgi:hypothetical protein